MTMAGMQVVFDALKGYSDPLGYVSDDGVRYDNLDLERDIDIVKKANRLLDICRYPDGRWIPMHDAWAYRDSRRVDPNVKPLEQSRSTLLPGVGHAWLGRGKGRTSGAGASAFFGGLWTCPCGQFESDAFCQGAGIALRCGLYPYPIPKLDGQHRVSQYCVDR